MIHLRPHPRASRSALRNIRVETHARLRDEIRLASIEITQPTPFGFGGRADPISDKRERKRQASAEFRQRSGE